MHNCVHHRNKLPVVFSTYFEENKVIHKYNTRQKMVFILMRLNQRLKKSIKYKGSKLCNDLPAERKEIKSLQSFKYKLKNYLLQSLTMLLAVKCCTCTCTYVV